MAVMEGYFLLNINIDGKGGVVASPSTTQPDYYYHWQRDGAISMNELMGIRTIQEAETQLQAYVGWVRAEQFQSDPNGIDVRGEPKFFLPDGAVYNGGVCTRVVSVRLNFPPVGSGFACMCVRLDAPSERWVCVTVRYPDQLRQSVDCSGPEGLRRRKSVEQRPHTARHQPRP
jgi:Glycosyl hydrolases family 15